MLRVADVVEDQHPADAESGQDVPQIASRSARRVIAIDRDEVEGQVGPLREEGVALDGCHP